MMRKMTNGPVLAFFALLVTSTAACAAQYVVVEARGVALKAGATLDGGQPLVLQQGQHVTLISDTGVTRGVAPVAPLPEAWLVDATHSGKACFEEGQQPIFWRAQPNAAARLAI